MIFVIRSYNRLQIILPIRNKPTWNSRVDFEKNRQLYTCMVNGNKFFQTLILQILRIGNEKDIFLFKVLKLLLMILMYTGILNRKHE